MTAQDYWALGGITATVGVGVISWILSAYLTKKSLKEKKLSYSIKLYPLVSKDIFRNSTDLKIEYKGEPLPEATLLAVDIANIGNDPIENPPIVIEAKGATYVLPGYIEGVEPGYDEIWELERTDAESCAIKVKHINPKQIIKARFLLDEFPDVEPIFKCPMPGLKLIKKVDTEMPKKIMLSILSAYLEKFF